MNRSHDIPLTLASRIHETARHLPKPGKLNRRQRQSLKTRIRRLLDQEDAVLVAHYYVAGELQQLAEETGGHVADSLDMANFGNRHPARTLVVLGVRFMGETAKILNPEKRILMPTLDADCSLDLGCPADEFSTYLASHPRHTVVVYANTSAAVKAQADWMVTSSNALPIVRHLKDKGEKIIWAPDRHLGIYIRSQTGADMQLWQGACVVHEEFRDQELKELKLAHPDAEILVHPESPAAVIAQADVVGSTSRLLQAARDSRSDTLIVATDSGLLHKMKAVAPEKKFLVAPTGGDSATCSMCGQCPWMALNDLEKMAHVLETGDNEIKLDNEVRQRALIPIQRMMEFSTSLGLVAQNSKQYIDYTQRNRA